jgi:hypothetical protein
MSFRIKQYALFAAFGTILGFVDAVFLCWILNSSPNATPLWVGQVLRDLTAAIGIAGLLWGVKNRFGIIQKEPENMREEVKLRLGGFLSGFIAVSIIAFSAMVR